MDKTSLKTNVNTLPEESVLNWQVIQKDFEKSFGTEVYSSWLKNILLVKEKNNEEEVMDNVEKLLEIWEKYFKYEDDLMEQYKYSDCAEHKKEHDDIRESIIAMKKMYSEGFKYVLDTLALSLNQWVEDHIKHISGKDRELGKFLNSKGVT